MRILLLVLFCSLFGQVWAQTEDEAAASGGGDPTSLANAATVNYAVGDLERLNKLELTTIYTAKLKRLHDILPFIPFQKLEPKSPNDLKIPALKMNEKALDSLGQTRAAYNSTLEGSLNAIVPYADKKAIIESIIFVQGIINKVELIGLGMNKLDY